MIQQSQFGHCPCCNPLIDFLLEKFTLPRRFLQLGTGALEATIALSKNLADATPPSTPVNQSNARADAIYINGEIITVNDAQPTAEAVAVKDGKILAVGTRTQVMQYQEEATRIIDLNGKIMVPGFIDAHSHILNYAIMTAVANLSPPPDSDVENIADIIEKLRQQIDTPTTKALGWVLGNGYDDFSPDGQTIASGSVDTTIKLWKLDGTELTTLKGHTAAIRGLAISRDGTILASVGEDNTLILWNLPRILNLDVLAYGCDRVRDYLHTNLEVQQRDTPDGTQGDRPCQLR